MAFGEPVVGRVDGVEFMIQTLVCKETHWSLEDRGSGPPLLLVHGFPLDHTMWQAQIEPLSARYRVIAPDLPGFGNSRTETSDPLTMEFFADQLAELLGALGVSQPVIFCGLSMGGYVALAFWARHPSRVAQLVLCDTRAAADDETTRRTRELTARRVLTEGTEFLVETMLPKLFAEQTLAERPGDVETIASVIRNTPPESVAGALRGMALRPDRTAELPDITVPATVVVGEHDAITPPEEMDRMAQSMPRATFHLLPGAGHMAPWEQPARFNELMMGSE